MRTIWIPVAGTLAAAVAIGVLRETGSRRETPPFPPLTTRDAEPEPPPPPARPTHTITVEDTGAFRHQESRETFRSVDELLDRLAPKDAPKPAVFLVPGSDKVTGEKLEEIAQRLRERCDVEVLPGDERK